MNQKKTIRIENKKAYYDYFILEKLECGISLWGNEVKSIREGKCNIKQAWCTIQDGNLVIRGMHISPWDTSNRFDVDENREKQLLAHKKEIGRLQGKLAEEGLTLIPLAVYFVENGKCKVEIGLCKGKKNYDKRESIKKRDMERAIQRSIG